MWLLRVALLCCFTAVLTGGLLASQLSQPDNETLSSELVRDVERTVPSLVDGSLIKFVFYNRDHLDGVPISASSSKEQLSALFNANLDTKIVVHELLQSPIVFQVIDSYARQQNLNMIYVDHTRVGQIPVYPVSTVVVAKVGSGIAELVEALMKAGVTSFKQLHLIGHGLGAHYSGYAGYKLGGNVARITGLDPYFQGLVVSVEFHLTRDDAVFVDIIHTNVVEYNILPHGHVDFYVNGAIRQVGCEGSADSYNEFYFCSHQRAVRYYNASIGRPKGFPAFRCSELLSATLGKCDKSSTTFMGAYTPNNVQGIFYVVANTLPPFVVA